jgi:hypothetical protein
MRDLDAAIYGLLSDDATLAGLAPGGIWRQVAPGDTPTPLVVFRTTDTQDSYAFSGLAYRRVTIEVVAVDRASSAEAAQAALSRADALLSDSDADLSSRMSAWAVRAIRRRSGGEGHFIDAGGTVWQTASSTYGIMVTPL